MAARRRTTKIEALVDEVRWFAAQVAGQARQDPRPFDAIGVSLTELADRLLTEADRIERQTAQRATARGNLKSAQEAHAEIAGGVKAWQKRARAWLRLVEVGAPPTRRVGIDAVRASLTIHRATALRAETVLRMALPRLAAVIAEDGRYDAAGLSRDGDVLLDRLVAAGAEVTARTEARAAALSARAARASLLELVGEVRRLWALVAAEEGVFPLRERREVSGGRRGGSDPEDEGDLGDEGDAGEGDSGEGDDG